MDDSQIFIVGANGQLGTALRLKYPNAKFADVNNLDITDSDSINNYNWEKIRIIINAAAYTNVDGAETDEGRVAAWKVNATAVGNLTAITRKHNMTLVHISTDYVFDGTKEPHSEEESFSPLSVYGSSKAAGDLMVSQLESYYIIRTSWVIGEGNNFVRTMLRIGKKGISPTVVSDQIGRLTFTNELVRAIDHLVTNKIEFGTYNVSNSGESVSWANITREIFKISNLDLTVYDTSTEEYYSEKTGIAPRPLKSTLSLDKILETGFKTEDWQSALKNYLKKEMNE